MNQNIKLVARPVLIVILSMLCMSAKPAAAEISQDSQTAKTAIKAESARIEGAKASLERFLALNQKSALLSKEGKSLLTGELKDNRYPCAGPFDLQPNKMVSLDETHVIGRVYLTNPDKSRQDFYMYMADDDGWKLEAIRTLAQTGMLRTMVYLNQTNPMARAAASTINMANVELTLKTDQELRDWFGQHKAQMEALRAAFVKMPAEIVVRAESTEADEAPIKKLLVELALSLAETKDDDLHFVIGGITDNSVGFLYSEKRTPPEISASEYIWVEDLGDGWYLFRTT